MARLRNLFGSATAVQQGLIVAGVFIVGFIVLGVISIKVWEVTNSTAFCADVCHDVHPEEPEARQDSYHANVQCVECHMGRVSTLRKIVLKASHSRHLPETLFQQYERPTEAETLIPPDQSCERCHWPPSFHGDTVREIEHYEQDRENTRVRTYLALRTGSGGARVATVGEGIHWHIANQVEFIAPGEDEEEIHWVRATFPDGSTVAYNDVTDPLAAEEIAAAEPKVMTCVDCHNQVGHPFYSPDTLVDLAMQTGQLSAELPYAKEQMTALLTREYESEEQAVEAAETLREQYETEYPEIAEDYQEEIDQAIAAAKDLLRVAVFEEEGITWESFPDHMGHGGHKPFAGCFRCHNGVLQSEEGDPIRIACNLCHSIPEKAQGTEQAPEVPADKVEGPPSHQEVDFLAEHRWQADESCGECHGVIEFGTDDSSFCANSACHGQEWPELNLDPTQEHPIPLEGQHAEVWCHDCHQGTREPEYVCANCHEPPPDHFGENCEDCHTPAGWESVSLGELGESFDMETHPFPLDHGGAEQNCSFCHPGGDPATYTCFTCHGPVATVSFHDARGLKDILTKCTACHLDDESVTFDHSGYAQCTSCHSFDTPAGHYDGQCSNCHDSTEMWREITFSHSELVDCQSCHAADAPESHYPAQCSNCHDATDTWTAITISHDDFVDCQSCHLVDAPANHYALQCSTCHSGTETWTAIAVSHDGFVDCRACHAVDAPANHYPLQCSTCHNNTETWTAITISHDDFVDCQSCHMVDAPADHYDGQCSNCHTSTETWDDITFSHSGLFDCRSCHGAPAGHYDGQCSNCHSSTSTWGVVSFDHTGYTDCASCHGAPEGHYDGQCSNCHNSTDTWGDVSFSHDGYTDCSSCHTAPADHYDGQCSDCHNSTETWDDVTFDHTNYTDCRACHTQPSDHPNTNAQCSNCHNTSDWDDVKQEGPSDD